MSYLQYVHPLQGTDSSKTFSNGNTLPLIALPHGMASWCPQTTEDGMQWFFHPSHHHFYGMRLTHQPSPWIRDYGNLVIMPQTGKVFLPPASRSSSFKKEDTVIKPDYFKTKLLRYKTTMELTPTTRCAMVRSTFEEHNDARFIISPFQGEACIEFDEKNNRVIGYTRSNNGGAPDNFAMYFALEFSSPIDLENSRIFNDNFEETESIREVGEGIGAYVGIELPRTGVVNVKMGTSFISIDQSIRNVNNEIGEKSFNEIRNAAIRSWEGKLGAIEIETNDRDMMRTFYTSMYRTLLFPRIWYEFNDQGEKIHYSPYNGKVNSGSMYSDHGFWDVYRTIYPLYSILFPSLLNDILQAWVNAYKESGWMPRWVSPGERGSMPGTLIDAVFADAISKGITHFDYEAAYEGLLKHATESSRNKKFGRQGLPYYLTLGYLPDPLFKRSVSNSLDYIYGDFCIAQVAKYLKKENDYKLLLNRAHNYKKLFDCSEGFMRGRNENGEWRTPFDPVEWGGPYCEGGAWQCSWAVQHDLLGLANLLGGKASFEKKLDELMTMAPTFKVGDYEREIHEMSEMASIDFGQFAISNQPSFHIPYIYTAIGFPHKTQYWVREALEKLFSYHPDGLPGDEDNGSLCAWYIFGALGIYPLTPGVPEYVIGSPLFNRIKLNLENGHQTIIKAENNSSQHKYVESITINDKRHEKLFITHEQIITADSISFTMSTKTKDRSYKDSELPFSLTFIGGCQAPSNKCNYVEG